MPGILDLLDSDMESNTNFIDENSLISSVSETSSITETKAASKQRPRKRKCVTVPKKPRAKTATSTDVKTATKTAGTKRKAVDDNLQEDDLNETKPTDSKARASKNAGKKSVADPATKVTKAKTGKKVAQSQAIEEGDSFPSPVVVRSNFAHTKPTKSLPKPVAAPKAKRAVPNTQRAPARVVEETVLDTDGEEDEDIVEESRPNKRPRTDSRVHTEPTYRRRAGSASDTDKGDPLLRRKLGNISRKYESIDVKYRNLKEVAIAEANTNVEKLRKQCETITEASNKLVTSLKKELALQAPLVQEARKSKKDTQCNEAEISRLKASSSDISAKLAAAQNEIKSLQAKLSMARATPAPVEVKPPPTVTKSVASAKAIMPISKESEKMANLKLDLYEDLTGLIVREVKQNDDGDTYDCIQTGRNGTLHFKLFVDPDNAKTVSYEHMEYLYTPLLDADRDKDLIEIMPDYLTEDITFERDVAAKFYARVVKTLTEQPSCDERE